MADFINDKSKPRKMLGITTRKQGSVNREEHPITALRRVARDFAAGVSALSRLATQTPVAAPTTRSIESHLHTHTHQATSASTHRSDSRLLDRTTDRSGRSVKRSSRTTDRLVEAKTHQRTNQSSQSLKEIQGGFSYKQSVLERALGIAMSHKRAANEPQMSQSSIRVPSPRLSPVRARSVRTSRASAIASGADREARHQLDHPQTGRAGETPSAARLAQILHADRLMSSGEVKTHPQVQRWAGAIRSGQRRSIADIHPEKVESVLHEAMGGREAAQRLNTPEVQQLIDRHHSTVQTIQTGLRESEKTIERAVRSRTQRGISSGTRVEPTRMSPALAARDYTGLVAPSGPADQRQDTARLAEMMATNEEPHLYAEDSERRQLMHADHSQMGVGPQGPQKDEARPNGAPESRSRAMASGISAMARREVPSAISAPPRSSVTASQEANQPNKDRKKERMEISGTMTLVSRGQTLGDMRVAAELR